MSRKVSLQLLADRLGLSKYAVSRALSGKSGVSPATRERVLELARALGYQIQRQDSASPEPSMGSKPAFVLICIKPLNRGEPNYWQRVQEGLASGCKQHGWHSIIVSPTGELPDSSLSPQETIAPHVDWNACAGVVALGSFPYATLQMIIRTDRPLVLVDHHDPMVACDKVNHANIEAGLAVAGHLLSLNCRKIGFLSDDGRTPSFAERRLGVKLAVERYSNPDTRIVEWKLPYEQGNWLDEAVNRFAQLPDEERPDAWIGVNDDIALHWMRKLQELGLQVPAQCRVAGIDNVQSAVMSLPRLTTVNLCKEEMGHRAIETLKRRIERPGSPAETILLSGELIPREST